MKKKRYLFGNVYISGFVRGSMKKEGSTFNFILCLIGVIFGIGSGVNSILSYFRAKNLLTGIADSGLEVGGAFQIPNIMMMMGIWVIIFSILILIFCFGLRKNDTLKKNSIICLILGILGLNIFVIIGAVGGIEKAKKREKEVSSI